MAMFSRIVILVRPGATNYLAFQEKATRITDILSTIEIGVWNAYGLNQTEAERNDWKSGIWLGLGESVSQSTSGGADRDEWCNCNYEYPTYDTDSEWGLDSSDPVLEAKHEAIAQVSDALNVP